MSMITFDWRFFIDGLFSRHVLLVGGKMDITQPFQVYHARSKGNFFIEMAGVNPILVAVGKDGLLIGQNDTTHSTIIHTIHLLNKLLLWQFATKQRADC